MSEMKKKPKLKKIMPWILAAVIIGAMAVGMSLFTHFLRVEQNSSGLQDQTAQGKNPKTGTADSKNEDINAEQGPADPNKKLSSGKTLWEAKLLLDEVAQQLKDGGWSESDLKSILEQTCRDFGTTMEEINRIPPEYVAAHTPSKPVNTATNKPSTGSTTTTSRNPSTGGSTTTPRKPSTGTTPTTPGTGGNTGETNLPPIPGTEIAFSDKILEQAIRDRINKPTGTLYKRDVEGITEFAYGTIFQDSIKDLGGIENLINLESLSLENTADIHELSALKGLTKLKYLDLQFNDIYDVSALAELTNLEHLDLGMSNYGISDIKPLMGLTKLKYLNLPRNGISEEDQKALKNALPNCQVIFGW